MGRKLGIAVMAIAMCAACGDDEKNPSTTGSNNTTSNTTSNNSTANANPGNNTPAAPWSAELMDAGDVGFGPISGSAVVVGESPEIAMVTGTIGADGASLSILFDGVTLAPGDFVADTFKIGFAREPGYQCTSSDVTVTFTTVKPYTATFAGAVSCQTQAQTDDPIEATVTGRFATN